MSSSVAVVVSRYDLKMGNAILAGEEHIPLYEEMVKDYDVEYIAGGSTQNTTRVLQWMLGDRIQTNFISCVGDDSFGKTLVDSAAADGVKTHFKIHPKLATGTCACLIQDKERSLVANLSAANEYHISHLQTPEMKTVLESGDIFYGAGFFLTVSPETALEIGKHAAEKNLPFAMNLSATFIPTVFKAQLESLLPYMDIVFGNLDESKAFGEAFGLQDTGIESVGKYLLHYQKVNQERKRIVVLTQGPDPVYVWDGKDEFQTFPVPKIPEEEIVDVNGAGDAFVGGFLAEFLRGGEMKACVAAGTYAASVILRVSGTKLPKSAPEFQRPE